MEATRSKIGSGFAGFDGFQLKLFALIAMTMDHLAVYLPSGLGIPDWFRLIGRFAAPLFVFFCAEGFYYTRSRGKYVARLYAASVLMTVCNTLVGGWLMYRNIPIMNAMFSTMFMITLTLWSVESLRTGIREKARRQIAGGALGLLYVIGGAVLHFGIYFALIGRIGSDGMLPQDGTTALLQQMMRVISLFIPNLITVEGGFLFVLLGVAFYYLRRWRLAQAAVLGVYCLLCLAAVPQEWLTHLFVFLSVIPMMLYNGKPGVKRHKYLFYWYYPLHVYIIYIAGWAMGTYLGVAA